MFSPSAAGAPVGRSVSAASAGGANAQAGPPRHPLLSDLDAETLQLAMQRLFDASKNLEDPAYKYLIGALCRLSAEMVKMQSGGEDITFELESREEVASTAMLSPKSTPHRQRVSGIHGPRAMVRFSLFLPNAWLIIMSFSDLETLGLPS